MHTFEVVLAVILSYRPTNARGLSDRTSPSRSTRATVAGRRHLRLPRPHADPSKTTTKEAANPHKLAVRANNSASTPYGYEHDYIHDIAGTDARPPHAPLSRCFHCVNDAPTLRARPPPVNALSLATPRHRELSHPTHTPSRRSTRTSRRSRVSAAKLLESTAASFRLPLPPPPPQTGYGTDRKIGYNYPTTPAGFLFSHELPSALVQNHRARRICCAAPRERLEHKIRGRTGESEVHLTYGIGCSTRQRPEMRAAMGWGGEEARRAMHTGCGILGLFWSGTQPGRTTPAPVDPNAPPPTRTLYPFDLREIVLGAQQGRGRRYDSSIQHVHIPGWTDGSGESWTMAGGLNPRNAGDDPTRSGAALPRRARAGLGDMA
ncbi:hypothetical protein C8J57DRAFT_1476133 [Mycena rebaudengoi]|nr:hypothetical protein C8J57DRAFT_1476133 [Mycena rebaudengoi]